MVKHQPRLFPLPGTLRAAIPPLPHFSHDRGIFQLLQLRVLGLGFFQNGDVRIGVFPKSKEILIGSASFTCTAGFCPGATELKMHQPAGWEREKTNARMI